MKCTRPSLPVEGLVPRLGTRLKQHVNHCSTEPNCGKTKGGLEPAEPYASYAPDSGRSPSSLSGWNNATLSLKQSARFWHKVWTEIGCSTSEVLFQIKKTVRRFKYEVHRLCRRQCHFKREKLADALSHSSSREFGNKLRRSLSPPKVVVPIPLPTLLMVVVTIVKLQIFSHLSLITQF